MRRHLVLPLAVLFIAYGVPSSAQMADAADADADVTLTVREGAPLTVECALRVEQRAEWRLDGAAPPADLRAAGEAAAGGRLAVRLAAPAARAHHAGLYTCARQPAQRVRVRVLPAALAAPAAPAAPAGEGAATPAAGAGGAGAGAGGAAGGAGAGGAADTPLTLTYYDVGRFFSFNCSVPRAADGPAYVWRKNGTAVEELWDLRDRYALDEGGAVFRMKARTHEDDFGNYTCALGGAAPARAWELRGRPHAKLPPNTNVVEGQKLKLTCKVLGKPYPAVTWTVANGTDDNATEVTAALGARVQLARSEQGVEGGELVLAAAERADAGVYTCAPAGAAAAPAATVLRVKDMYAALWPFLGICAEVFVLCAIILVYEKRRTKPELDDSDTDNHDQKKS